MPFPSPGDLPNPGIEPMSPALQVDSLPSELSGKTAHVMRATLTQNDENYNRKKPAQSPGLPRFTDEETKPCVCVCLCVCVCVCWGGGLVIAPGWPRELEAGGGTEL